MWGGHGELCLSFDDNPENKEMKYNQPDYGGVGGNEFMMWAEKKSEPILLAIGQAYFHEVRVFQYPHCDYFLINSYLFCNFQSL